MAVFQTQENEAIMELLQTGILCVSFNNRRQQRAAKDDDERSPEGKFSGLHPSHCPKIHRQPFGCKDRARVWSFAWKTNNTSQAAKRPLFRCPPNWRKTCPAPQPPLALPAEDREEGLFAELTARLGSLPGAYLCMKTKSSNDNSNLV